MANEKDGWDKFKIWAEVIAVAISLGALIWGGITYFYSLKIDKSQLLYKDFVIEGVIPLTVTANKIARAHISPQSETGLKRYQMVTSFLPSEAKYADLISKNADINLMVDPLTDSEKKQIKKASEEAIDLLNSRLFFLGRNITNAINCSINLLRDETPFFPSPSIYFSSSKRTIEKQIKQIRLADAYRYRIFVNTNFRFLRDSLKTIADYILENNIHTYKEMAQISELSDDNCSEKLSIVLRNLAEFRKLYLAYVNWWKGMPSKECLEKNTELLVSFFEKYMKNEGKKIAVKPTPEEMICKTTN